MALQSKLVQSGRVAIEGDDLFYEVYGQGQPLMMIPPAGGDGWHYSFVAEILADEYKVITFDRRANGRSTMHAPQNFEISQQSRDAVALLHAVGETSAHIFGNSSAAAIVLDMAKTQPKAIRAVVAHEAPLARLHPKAARWQAFFASVYSMSYTLGPSLAALRFFFGAQLPALEMIKATKNINAHRKQSKDPYISDQDATQFMLRQELLPVTNYLPDIEAIQRSNGKVFIAVSQWGLQKKTWYAIVAQILAEQLGCELVTFPGHHGSFLDMPGEWAAVLREVLHRA